MLSEITLELAAKIHESQNEKRQRPQDSRDSESRLKRNNLGLLILSKLKKDGNSTLF